jgi:F-type H+-transporting ATPase subunit epsilon
VADIECIVVTPEKTALSVKASSVTIPMDDGQLGILPGRAPMIGRLGYGPMKIETTDGAQSYFIEGGFVQVTREAVNVLTDQLLTIDSISKPESEAQLEEALAMPSTSVELIQIKEKAVRRARAKVAITSKTN